MTAQTKAIQDHFLAAGAGWRPLLVASTSVLSAVHPMPDIFVNTYACCGVVAAESATQVETAWKVWEQELVRVHRKFRQDEEPTPNLSASEDKLTPESRSENIKNMDSAPHYVPRDLFLVLIVEKMSPAEASMLTHVANDTFGSRKILLSCEGRTVAATLNDLAFFSAREAASASTAEAGTLRTQSSVDLGPAILDDLARRSPNVIFDRLLEGRYPVSN